MGLLRDYLQNNTDPFVHSMLQVIVSGATRMNRLTTNALTLVQLDSGQMDVVYEKARKPVDIQRAVEQALVAVDGDVDLKERNVTITVTGTQEPLIVIGLLQCLVMMIEELLRNAVVFSPKGGTVTLELARKDSTVSVAISDDGQGMTPEQLDQVWGRFAQVDRRTREQQGAGLGLPLVWGCVQLHGGECTLQSSPGQGTVATLRLPLAAPAL
jgi:signal transduction histidine kinase